MSIKENYRYLDLCREAWIEPEKPFRGTFDVRTGSDLHRRASVFAKQRKKGSVSTKL
jgi:predicted HicB family RNase H-like nuclease